MGYTDIFGGETIFPSLLSYLKITTAVDVTLQWPREQQIEGLNVVADFLDVDATAPSVNIDLPSASVTSTGNKATINNVGSNAFDVRDSTGGAIQTVQPGEQWVIVLTDNTTAAGAWSTFQLGATVSVASASALAGAGIKAIGVLLNQKIDSDEESMSPITVVEGDRAKCLIYTAGAGVADLPSAGAVGDDWFFMLRNSGSGTLNVLPAAGEIDGSSSINLDPQDSAFIFTDGANWFTVGLSSGSTLAFDFVELPVPGSGDFVLSGANLDRISYRFTGALTGTRTIIVPNTTQQYWCDNQTTGAFQLFISTAGQATPPEIEQDEQAIFYCDALSVIVAVSDATIPLPLAITKGGTGATTAADARNNLQVAFELIDMIAGLGLVGGGTLENDRTFDVGPGVGIGVNADDVALDYSAVPVEVPAAGDFITFQDIDDADNIKKATIADLVDPTPQQLFDSSNNVRVSAELLGVAELRSDGNVDAEIRALVGTHADQTVRWGVGQPTASPNLVIENLMTGGAIQLRSGPSSSVTVFVAGTLRATFGLSAQFDVFADGATETELQVVQLKDSGGNIKGSWGWTNTEAKMHLSNTINGQPIEIRADAFGGAPRSLFLGDPDTDVKLYHAGVETFRTVATADGGAEANNLDTGAGFERVLTTADLGGGGGGNSRGCLAFGSNNQTTFSGVELTVLLNSEAYDTDNIHDNAVNNSRLTVPAGVTKIRLKAMVTWAQNVSGFRQMRIVKNGSAFIGIDDNRGIFLPVTTVDSMNNINALGMNIVTGIVETVATDYFQLRALQNSGSGINLFRDDYWLEMEIIE